MATTLDKMDLDELLELQHDNMAARSELAEEGQAIQDVIDVRLAEQEAIRKLGNMSPKERAALAQVLKTNGIASAEAVGDLGR